MATVPKRDFYEILGVPRDCSNEQLKSAFRKLAMEYHPDRNPDPAAAERFKEIGAAYEVLSDPEKRRRYDRFGSAEFSAGFEGFDFGGFGDIFDAFFGGRRADGPVRGVDLQVQLELDFAEAVFGAEKELAISRQETCTACRGDGAEPGTDRIACPQCGGAGEIRRAQRSVFGQFVNVATCDRCEGLGSIVSHPCRTCGGVGREQRNRRIKVKVPAGIADSARLRFTEEGGAGSRGGTPGHLYVDLHVRPHPVFAREGDDLVLDLPLSLAQAALGAEIEVPTLEGGSVPLQVRSGTQHGQAFRLRGHGVPRARGRARGDLVVRAQLHVPTKLTEEQRALFEQLNETLGSPTRDGHESGFFSRIRDAFSA